MQFGITLKQNIYTFFISFQYSLVFYTTLRYGSLCARY